MTTRHANASTSPRRQLDESMTLLTEFYRRPLDPGYAIAARRRAAGSTKPVHPARRVAQLVTAILLGLVVTAAALTLHQPTSAAQRAREVLENSITERGDEVLALQQQQTELSTQIATLQSALVGSGDAALRDQLAAGSVEAGLVAVTGPGLQVEMSDAPTAQTDDLGDEARVQDVDLQIVVNGLWAAGAEAVAVNGQRVTGTTAIRSAGSAILVDLVPLTSPYRVEAIGNATTLQTGLVQSTAGELISALRATYGIGVSISAQDELELSGTGQTALQQATVPDALLPEALRPDARATPAADAAPAPGAAASSWPPLVAASSHTPRDDAVRSGVVERMGEERS